MYLYSHLGVVLATAQLATAGAFLLYLPTGSTVTAAFRRVEFVSQIGSVLATPTSPRIAIERVTVTGTPAAAVATTKRDSTDAASQARVQTTLTGLVVANNTVAFAVLPHAAATAVGATGATIADWNPSEEAMPVLRVGEGLLCRQLDAGTASDTRRWVMNIAWEEFTTP
jgi:hypothetical protein